MSENKLQLFKDTRAANRRKGTPAAQALSRSRLGYRDDSPYKNEAYIDIDTPNGVIDMSETGIDLMANGKLLPAYSGMHQFDTTKVREVPLHQDGGETMELDDAEIAEYKRQGYRIEEFQDGGSTQPNITDAEGNEFAWNAEKNGYEYVQPSVKPVVQKTPVQEKPAQEKPWSMLDDVNYTPRALKKEEPVVEQLSQETKEIESPYTSKETIDPEPDGWQNWEDIKERKEEINKMTQADRIISSHASDSSDANDQYLIVDKKRGRMHLYRGSEEIDSFEVLTGQNEGDAQTVTVQKYRDPSGKAVDVNEAMANTGAKTVGELMAKGYTAAPDWSAGNKSTGAGVFTVSGSDPHSKYRGMPSFNLKNDQGIEVSTALHAAPQKRDQYYDKPGEDNRKSFGCINGKCTDMNELYSKYHLTEGNQIYILPDDEDDNEFVYENGKVNFHVKDSSSQTYTDARGVEHEDQGINRSVNTLNASPIKMNINLESLKTQSEGEGGFSGGWSEEQYTNTIKPFVETLETEKSAIMEAAHINGDVYNEIAKMTFGIFGTESNYGDEHSATSNFMHAAAKWWDKDNSSPDYKSKANTYGATGENNSVGVTQLRWSFLDDAEKKALGQLGITSNKDFMDPKKAAIATATVLGIRYNQQLTDAEKKDMWKTLPSKWNNRENYSARVNKNASHMQILQKSGNAEESASIPEHYIRRKQGGETMELNDMQIAHYRNMGYKIEEM